MKGYSGIAKITGILLILSLVVGFPYFATDVFASQQNDNQINTEYTCTTCDTCELAITNAGSGDTIKLTADIVNQATTCIDNPADFTNIIFDCDGHTIDGDDGAGDYGIYIGGQSYDTIQNCIFTDFGNTIFLFEGSDHHNVINTTVSSSAYGIVFDGTDTNLTNNRFISNTYGINIQGSNNFFINNTVMNNTIDIYAENVVNNIFTNLSVNQTLLNFTGYNYLIKEVKDNERPAKINNLSTSYINVTNLSTTSWAYLNISYDQGYIESIGKTEDNIVMQKYNDMWYNVTNAYLSELDNYTYSNITTFSIIGLFLEDEVTSNCTYTGTIDSWYIGVTEDCEVADIPMNITGNISIYGNLTLSNIDLVLNVTGSNSSVYSYEGSNFTIVNQTNITINNTAYYYDFEIDSTTLQINNSYISYATGLDIETNSSVIFNNTISFMENVGIWNNNNLDNGLNATIINNTIYNTTDGIILHGPYSLAHNNTIFNCSDDGIDSAGTRNNITNNTIYDVADGIIAQTTYNIIDRNNIFDITRYGILITESYATITNNKISDVTNTTGADEFRLDGINITGTFGLTTYDPMNTWLENNTIKNIGRYGITITGFNVTIKNCNISNTTMDNILINSNNYTLIDNLYIDSESDSLVNITAILWANGTMNLNRTYSTTTTGNVTGYLNITNTSEAWIYLNFSYNDTVVSNAGATEAQLRIWRYDGSSWSALQGVTNTSLNYITYNITNFSIFAIRGDIESPEYYNSSIVPASPQMYAYATTQFNLTWYDDNTVSEVLFEWNGTNYTYSGGDVTRTLVGSNYVYHRVESLHQTVGVYTYKWYCNDTSNNWNTTSGTFEITTEVTGGDTGGGGGGDDDTTPIDDDETTPIDEEETSGDCPDCYAWDETEQACVDVCQPAGTICCRVPALSINPPKTGIISIMALTYDYNWLALVDCLNANGDEVPDEFCQAVPSCPSGQYWDGDKCVYFVTTNPVLGGGGGDSVMCGNGWCEYPETESSCPADCSVNFGTCTADQNVSFNVKPPYISAFGEPGATITCTGEQYCSLVVENPSSQDILVYVQVGKVITLNTGEIDPSYQWVSLLSATNDVILNNTIKLAVPGGSELVPGQAIVVLKTDVPLDVTSGQYEYNIYLTSPCFKRIVRFKTVVGQFNIFGFLENFFNKLLFTEICLPNGVCFASGIVVGGILGLIIVLFVLIGRKYLKKKRYQRE